MDTRFGQETETSEGLELACIYPSNTQAYIQHPLHRPKIVVNRSSSLSAYLGTHQRMRLTSKVALISISFLVSLIEASYTFSVGFAPSSHISFLLPKRLPSLFSNDPRKLPLPWVLHDLFFCVIIFALLDRSKLFLREPADVKPESTTLAWGWELDMWKMSVEAWDCFPTR